AVVELPDGHVWAEDGRLRPMGEVWTRFGRLLERIPTKGPDVSFARFLAQRRVPAPTREMARLFVEGYFAAHVDRVSAQSIASPRRVEGRALGGRRGPRRPGTGRPARCGAEAGGEPRLQARAPLPRGLLGRSRVLPPARGARAGRAEPDRLHP